MLRLRPNIHVDVGSSVAPFEEDDWRELSVTDASSPTYKATIRCVFGTVRCLSLNADLATGTTVPKPRQLYGLLAKDRRVNSAFPRKQKPGAPQCEENKPKTNCNVDKPVFGQYAFAAPNGATIRVGDVVRVIERAKSRSESPKKHTASQNSETMAMDVTVNESSAE